MNNNYDSNNNYYAPIEPIDNGYDNQNQNNQNQTPSGFATAAMVLGIITLASNACCMLFVNIITGILAIVFANVAKNNSADKVMPQRAKTGLICAVIGLIISIVLTVIVILFYAAMIRAAMESAVL